METPRTTRDSGLETRTLTALRRLGIRTIDELRALEVSEVLRVFSCGEGVRQHLLTAQRWLKCEDVDRIPGPDRLSLPFRLLLANLTRKARRFLKKLGVEDLHDLTGVRFVDCRRSGPPYLYPESWEEISFIRRQAVQVLGGIVLGKEDRTVSDPNAIVLDAPTEDTLLALPLFSGLEPDFFATPRFHLSWHADWTISDLALPARARIVCEGSGIDTFGQLLLVQGNEFITRHRSGESTLEDVYDVVRFVLLGGLADSQTKVDYSDFDSMVDSWIPMAIPASATSSTFVGAVRRRFRPFKGKLLTLERIAQECGVSRSRVGHIWKLARPKLRRRQSLYILERFWVTVRRELAKGPRHLDQLAASISEAFHWADVPSGAPLRELLSLNPEIDVDDRGYRLSLSNPPVLD